jgi:hypothetical protein
MDTRFWGPSGWIFLHQISFSYEPVKQKKYVQQLLEMLPFVLPCKFCRTSLTEYMEELPLEPALDSREALTHWMYDIHNKVNEKLRNQGQPVPPNPTFSSVQSFYTEALKNGCTKTFFPGWTFLFSLAENHPLSRQNLNTSPIPNAPHRTSGMSDKELNKYNLFRPRERMPYYKKFWEAIGESLPFLEWRRQWKALDTKYHLQKSLGKRWPLLKALWKVRCEMETSFELQNKTKFADLCETLASHRSGCAKSVRARTCRRARRNNGRKTLRR